MDGAQSVLCCEAGQDCAAQPPAIRELKRTRRRRVWFECPTCPRRGVVDDERDGPITINGQPGFHVANRTVESCNNPAARSLRTGKFHSGQLAAKGCHGVVTSLTRAGDSTFPP